MTIMFKTEVIGYRFRVQGSRFKGYKVLIYITLKYNTQIDLFYPSGEYARLLY